jgi:hypothetical protein
VTVGAWAANNVSSGIGCGGQMSEETTHSEEYEEYIRSA